MVTKYALVTSSGEIIKFKDFEDGQQPVLPIAKNLRWLIATLPEYNSIIYTAIPTTPVSSDAVSITYEILTSETQINKLINNNKRAAIDRKIKTLKNKGKKLRR